MINKRVQVEGSTEQVKKYLDKNFPTEEDTSTLDQAKVHYGKLTVIGGPLVTLWSEKIKIRIAKENNNAEILFTVSIVKYLVTAILFTVIAALGFYVTNQPSIEGVVIFSISLILISPLIELVRLYYRLYQFVKRFKKDVKKYISIENF